MIKFSKKSIKRNSMLFGISLLVAVLLGIAGHKTANSKIITNVPADISGSELMAVVIEDFEKSIIGDKGWSVTSEPKSYTNKDAEKKLKRKNPIPVLSLKLIEGKPNDMNVEKWSLTGLGMKKEKVLGVNFKFRYPGNNSIHILPPPEISWHEKKPVMTYNRSLRQEKQERGIQLPGKAKALSIWVHGRGHPYRLEMWLKDYRGNTHIIKFGSVNFVGWRPLKAEIPLSIPQSYESYPQTRVLKITRIVVRSNRMAHKEELMGNTYFFFDQLKVLTDTYEVNFDGQDLHKKFNGGSSNKK